MKKIFAIMLALVLVLAMGIPAMAATITVPGDPDGDQNSNNETYNAYKIFDVTKNGTGGYAYTIEKVSPWVSVLNTAEQTYVTLSLLPDGKHYSVTANNLTAANAKAFAEYLWNHKPGDANSIPLSVGSNNVDDGYYLIISSLGSALALATTDIPVDITEKNEYPSVTKKIVSGADKVDSITADRGQTITFEITVTIPKTVDTNKVITVHDKLDTAMTYVEGPAADTGVDKYDSKCNNCSFEFVIKPERVRSIVDNISADATSGTCVFTYTAKLNGDATTATAHPNKAYITYSNFQSVEDEVNVYTYEIDVFKYTTGKNDADEIGLAGASFVLKNADGKYYYKNDNGVVTWVDSVENATVLTTAEDSYTVKFAGLANGVYTLVETQAPNGYNPADDRTVTINNANLTGDKQIKVLNQAGTVLPSTGGIGTTIFYVVGGLLMAAAIVLLVTKKKVSSK